MSHLTRKIRRSLPPVPKVWSPGRLWRWIKARPRRYKAFKRLAVLAALALIAVVVARPVAHVVKAWQARRLAAEASRFIEQEDWKSASRNLQDAFRIWFNEPEVWRVQARFLSRVGQNQEALRWWQKVAETQPLTKGDRRDYAAVALSVRDLRTAEGQIEKLTETNVNPEAFDLVLAGTLSSFLGYTTRAIEYGRRALEDPSGDAKAKLGGASLIFTNSSPNSKEYSEAYDHVVKIAREPNDNRSLHALSILARQTPPNSQLQAGSARLSPQPRTLSGPSSGRLSTADRISASEIAERLETHPRGQPFHRMLALEVRARDEPQRAQDLVTEAVAKFGKGDDETLTMLAAWLYTRRDFETILKVLPPDRVMRSRQLFIQRVDALAALGRYPELQEMLLREQSVIDPSMQHMFLAVVRAKMGETVASANEWERALDEADSLQKLSALAEYAEKNNALETADAAYERAISRQPDLRSAYAARLRLAQAMGRTDNARKIAQEILRRWPDDNAIRVREIYLRLLLDTSATAGRSAEEELAPLLARNPWDQPSQTALALARLRQGRMAAALEAAPQPGPGVAPSAPLAVAWAANGWSERAKEELQKLATVKLLPEERALIAPLLQERHDEAGR